MSRTVGWMHLVDDRRRLCADARSAGHCCRRYGETLRPPFCEVLACTNFVNTSCPLLCSVICASRPNRALAPRRPQRAQYRGAEAGSEAVKPWPPGFRSSFGSMILRPRSRFGSTAPLIQRLHGAASPIQPRVADAGACSVDDLHWHCHQPLCVGVYQDRPLGLAFVITFGTLIAALYVIT